VTTKKFGLLPSVHGVERHSQGGLYYPIAVYLSFFIATRIHRPDLYVIGILVLAVSDSLAALVGGRYGFKLYVVEEDTKSLEGSIIFFLATFLTVHLILLLLTGIDPAVSVLSGLYIALLITAFESISLDGSDNLIIPIGTIVIAHRAVAQSWVPLAVKVLLLVSLFTLVAVLARRTGRIGLTAAIGITLMGFGAYEIAGMMWLLPILLAMALICVLDIFIEPSDDPTDKYRIRPVFFILLVSVFWVMVAGFTVYPRDIFFAPYAMNMIANLGILWHRRALFNKPYRWKIPKWFQDPPIWARSSMLGLTITGPSLLLLSAISTFTALIGIIIGAGLIELAYWRYAWIKHPEWDRVQLLRFTAVVSLLVSFLWAVWTVMAIE
ncbi:MAG: hypothetical protein ACLFQY_17220, partial [Desulfococcaceae bacterium]